MCAYVNIFCFQLMGYLRYICFSKLSNTIHYIAHGAIIPIGLLKQEPFTLSGDS